MPNIRLSAACGTEVVADKDAMSISQMLRDVMEDAGSDDVIPLSNVSIDILRKVISYCDYHKNSPPAEIPKPLKSDDLSDYVCDFDVSFVNVENPELFALLLAANYMDITSLLNLCCAKVATLIKGKTPQEIREKFHIHNDFTPEEEAQVAQENRWVDNL